MISPRPSTLRKYTCPVLLLITWQRGAPPNFSKRKAAFARGDVLTSSNGGGWGSGKNHQETHIPVLLLITHNSEQHLISKTQAAHQEGDVLTSSTAEEDRSKDHEVALVCRRIRRDPFIMEGKTATGNTSHYIPLCFSASGLEKGKRGGVSGEYW
ncbi:hypothetical protein CEXT_199531 [Caerostris extrusa]|uniref:Uncharacterized protein n=1 Tax=Caerostris extrusa TaxID=172846 RepID=A0AAV4U9A9_CAEEX|nr:hypothetical protein CEXT_199531 [Caerostris extrusa]